MLDVDNFWKIPILTVNYNHRSFLQKQVSWLLRAGYKNIVVIDNCSTYAPLLDYYEVLEKTHGDAVRVVRLDKNFGHYALWNAKVLERLGIDGPFVCTDSDIVPDAAVRTMSLLT